MTPERIAELRLYEKHFRASGQLVGAVIKEILDALHDARIDATAAKTVADEVEAMNSSLRAELQRLQSSPAPVAGGVPDIADEDYESVAVLMYDHVLGSHDDENEEFRRIVAATWQCCQAYAVDAARAASRIPAIKTGEVEALLRIESCARSLRDCGPEYIGAEECRLLDRLDAIRAQATTSGGGTT